MLYSAKRYLYEALTFFDAIEESSGRTVSQKDAGVTDAQWADFLSHARLDVMRECLRYRVDFVSSKREEITVSTGGSYNLAPPGSILTALPMSITLVEGQGAGQFYPLDMVPSIERWMYENQHYTGIGAYPAVWCYEGTTLRLYPSPGAEIVLRVTYVPMPERYEVLDLARDTPDLVVPVAVQDAVPVRAAWYACVKDQDQRDLLLALWGEKVAYIRDAAALRQTPAADYITYTGGHE